MEKLKYSKNIVEEFAIKVISNSYDELYSNFVWNKQKDDFDFISTDDLAALEVTLCIDKNVEQVLSYESSLSKGNNPDPFRIKNSHIDDKNKELLLYYGGSMEEMRKLVIEKIKEKEEKRKNRSKKYNRYELCLCVDDGSLFNRPADFEFIIGSGILSKTKFSRLFIITCSNFYVIENNKIKEYKRIVQND